MEVLDQTLSKVLEARENRARLRKNIARSGFDSVSLTLNIPGYPKNNKLLSAFFSEVLKDLLIFLQANRIFINTDKKLQLMDDAGAFFIVPLQKNDLSDILEIKRKTEQFEKNHKLGRLTDVDVFDKNANPVSSGKEKPCYFCGEHSAVSCMRNERHSYEEIREKIFKDIANFLNEKYRDKQISKICSLAQRAVLYEVSLSKKPGLVCFEDQGAHKDMNFFTFLNSTAALAPYFREFCELGYQHQGSLKKVLPKIREIGLRAEDSMFSATDQINTHKGIIFLFGISLFAISKILSEKNTFSEEYFQVIIKIIGENLVDDELGNLKNTQTHGERVYLKYGIEGAGIRNEIEKGMPTVFQTAVPFFSQNLYPDLYKDQEKLQEVLLTGLLKIISVNNDTNILYRSDLKVLHKIKNEAARSVSDDKAREDLLKYCREKNISPGGSADLLAVSLLVHFINTEKNEF
ncbi:MAG: hypothetical protein DSY82_03895 [Flavobacteriia bacterium]|nr:MAG: hypothetical protein DSY82_03895 [Flavobacteriia bacterium]